MRNRSGEVYISSVMPLALSGDIYMDIVVEVAQFGKIS